jgi:hypothetical protein
MAFGMACMSPAVLAEFSVTNKTFDLDSDVVMHDPAALLQIRRASGLAADDGTRGSR